MSCLIGGLQSTLKVVAKITAACPAGEVDGWSFVNLWDWTGTNARLPVHDKPDICEASLPSIPCCTSLAEADMPMALSERPRTRILKRLPDVYRTCQTPALDLLLGFIK